MPQNLKDVLSTALPDLIEEAAPRYLEEPRGLAQGRSKLLARPRSSADVARLVSICAELDIGIVPYSGGTGLVGGQVADDGRDTLIVSFERMNAIREIDGDDRSMVVEAGVILSDIHDKAAGLDLIFPLTLASQGSARIGGLLSTNAGGVNVIRYGNARNLCLGVEAVMADGSIVHGLKSLRKDNTGYDLRHLMIGAEGTLGLITAARLSLAEKPKETVVGLLQVDAPDAALALLSHMRATFGELVSAFELIDATGVGFILETMPDCALPPVESWRWMVLIELGAGAKANLMDRFEAAMEQALESDLIIDGLVAQSDAQAAVFWNMRESIPQANKLVGAIASHDISVPVSKVPAFIKQMSAALCAVDETMRINSFGHLGDGNLHYNLFPPLGGDRAAYSKQKPQLTRMVHDLVADFGGSFSAEHGVGRFKKDELIRYGDPGKLLAMRAIKSALDPKNIMNPGAVIDP